MQPSTGGVPLDEWRKDTPPGWKPGIENYPLKVYFAKLKLWYRCSEVPDEVIGPLVAGRLQGRAQRIALELKLIRPDGGYDVGDAALVRLSVDEVIDPADGITVLQAHIPSGVQALCNALRDAFGDTDEAQTTRALEQFFEHKRPHGQELQEFAAEWDLRYEDARSKAGLEMNSVAMSYLWLKQAGLSQKHQDDLRLQVKGDLSKFNEIRGLAVRLSHRMDLQSNTGDVFYEDNLGAHYDQDHDHDWEDSEIYWADPWWSEGSWSYADSESWGDMWYQDEDELYEFQEEAWFGDSAGEPGYQGEDHVPGAGAEEIYSAGGKSRGKGAFGSGCHVCGSKWHMAADCPVKGKGNSFEGKGKSSGKGKGRFGKAKGKGKGKSKGKKGFGKGWRPKGPWQSPWAPRYYTDDGDAGYYDTYQLQHARHGLSLGDSPRKSTATSTTKYFNIAQDNETTSETKNDYFQDLLRLERVRSAAAHSTEDTPTLPEASEERSEFPKKNLSFFRKHEDHSVKDSPRHQTYHEQVDQSEVYRTVEGHRRRGLIIDPGAANGLIGTETLRDLLEHVDRAKEVGQSLEWKPKQSEVTGISGAADTTLGEITLRLPMIKGLEEANYKADVIGGTASMCPALVGNPALVGMKAILCANWFTNRDGLLAIPSADNDFHLIRLLLTDSKHYLLPLDNEQTGKDMKDEMTKVKTFVTQVQNQSSKRWTDVRTWFTWATTAKPKRSQPEEARDPDQPQMPPPTATSAATLKTTEDTGAKEVRFLDETNPPTATSATLETTEDTGAHLEYDTCATTISGTVYATSAISDEVLKSAEIDSQFVAPQKYMEDSIPPDMTQTEQAKLIHYCRDVKEEYYTRSGYAAVSPNNHHVWCQSRQAKRKSQLWEIGHSAGRLSYLALLAGLAVTFPVDRRYGWDMTNPVHQRLLLETQRSVQPSVIVFSCPGTFFTTSFKDMNAAERARARDSEHTVANFVKQMVLRQVEAGNGFLLGEPWLSDVWKTTCLANLENEIPGCRRRQRTDYCAYGAVDQRSRPLPGSAGLQANFSLRSATHRCRGHEKEHGKLSHGSTDWLRRPQPKQLCRAIIKDVKKYLATLGETKFIGYKCPKCAQGRNAPPGTEHTLVLRECRHASPLPTPAGASTAGRRSSEASSSSQPPVRSMVKTPLSQLIEEFKQNALRKPNLDDIKLQMPEGLIFSAVDTITLKSLLTELVNDSVNIISEAKGKHNHWSQDPLHLAILRKIFAKSMTVKGVSTSLQSETLPTPMPFLRTESAPLRMIIRGEVKAWTIKPIEDLRTYTDGQLKAKHYAEDWIIAIFGSSPQDRDYWEIDKARGRATRHHELQCSPRRKTKDH